jgi:hypothetical protein
MKEKWNKKKNMRKENFNKKRRTGRRKRRP